SYFRFFFSIIPPPPTSTLFPYTTLFRSTYKLKFTRLQNLARYGTTSPACCTRNTDSNDHNSKSFPLLSLPNLHRCKHRVHCCHLSSRKHVSMCMNPEYSVISVFTIVIKL